MRLRALVVAGVAVGTLAALSAAAQAATPVVIEKHNSLTRHFANLPTCASFGFTHTEDYQVTRTITLFFDREGNLLREVLTSASVARQQTT